MCNVVASLRSSVLRHAYLLGALDAAALDLCRLADLPCLDLRANVTALGVTDAAGWHSAGDAECALRG